MKNIELLLIISGKKSRKDVSSVAWGQTPLKKLFRPKLNNFWTLLLIYNTDEIKHLCTQNRHSNVKYMDMKFQPLRRHLIFFLVLTEHWGGDKRQFVLVLSSFCLKFFTTKSYQILDKTWQNLKVVNLSLVLSCFCIKLDKWQIFL